MRGHKAHHAVSLGYSAHGACEGKAGPVWRRQDGIGIRGDNSLQVFTSPVISIARGNYPMAILRKHKVDTEGGEGATEKAAKVLKKTIPPVALASDITAEWLSAVMKEEVLELQVKPVGMGQVCRAVRAAWKTTTGAAKSVVVKFSSDDPAARKSGSELGLYRQETVFYGEFSHKLEGSVPRCFHSDGSNGAFTLVLEDKSTPVKTSQAIGAAIEQAKSALHTLAKIQGPFVGEWMLGASSPLFQQPNFFIDQELYIKSVELYLEAHKEDIEPEHAEFLRWLGPNIDAWAKDRRPPLGLFHGDYRLDNMLFSPANECTVLDWQTVGWGSAFADASYFVGSSLTTELRRTHEKELFAGFLDELDKHTQFPIDREHAWEEYRRQTIYALLVVINCFTTVEQTPVGMKMASIMVGRTAQQALDLDFRSLMAEGLKSTLPLRPTDADEGMHLIPPSAGLSWNESWYADGSNGEVGWYVRMGRLDKQGICLFMACVARRGKPTVLIIDRAAPLPASQTGDQVVVAPKFTYEQYCDEPHKTWRFKLKGVGEAYEDHSAPLRSEAGEPIAVEFDFVSETQGIPYMWRLVPRYEVPCIVKGSVTVAGETTAVVGGGQRDHSWGHRDWLSNIWMWNCLHFEDGMHIQSWCMNVGPTPAQGYVQKGDSPLVEITETAFEPIFLPNGLLESAVLRIQPGNLVLNCKPAAAAPWRFFGVEDDKRESNFPRFLTDIVTGDGVKGYGWLEWNHPLHMPWPKASA